MNYNELGHPYYFKDQIFLPTLCFNDPNTAFDFTSTPNSQFTDSGFDVAAQFNGWQRGANLVSSFSSGDSFDTSASSDTSFGQGSSPSGLVGGGAQGLGSGTTSILPANLEEKVNCDIPILKPETASAKAGPGRKQGKRPGRKSLVDQDRPKKPEKTYIELIEEAIKAHETKRATLNEIYAWLKVSYPDYFTAQYDGWKNSIRHNLSLNQCFLKLNKSAGNTRAGKGHYWSLNPDYPIEKASQNAKRFKLPTACTLLKKPKPISQHKSHTTMQLNGFGVFGDGEKSPRFTDLCQLPSTINTRQLPPTTASHQLPPTTVSHQLPSTATTHQFTDPQQLTPIDPQQLTSTNQHFLDASSFALSDYPNYLLPSSTAFGYPVSGSFHAGIWPTTMDGNSAGLLMPLHTQMDIYPSPWEPKTNSPSQTASLSVDFKSKICVGEPKKEGEKMTGAGQKGGIPTIDTLYPAQPSSTTSNDFQPVQHLYSYPTFSELNPTMMAGNQLGSDQMSEVFFAQQAEEFVAEQEGAFVAGQEGEFVQQPTVQYELVSTSVECSQY